jgi:hypothetical protein
MNRWIGCARMELGGLPSRDAAVRITVLCHTPVLRAAFSLWEPERPELLVRLRPRVRDMARRSAH